MMLLPLHVALVMPYALIILAVAVVALALGGWHSLRTLRKEIGVYSLEQQDVYKRLGVIDKHLKTLVTDHAEDDGEEE